MEEVGSDVAFEALELFDQRGGVGAEVFGCLPQSGVGHGQLESVEPLPSVELSAYGLVCRGGYG